MADLLVDTDIFIDHLRGTRPLVREEHWLSYSIVTRMELFGGRNDERATRRLLDTLTQLDLDVEIAEQAGRLSRDAQLDVADALIAATALAHKLTVFTRNRRNFERVRGLKIRSPG